MWIQDFQEKFLFSSLLKYPIFKREYSLMPTKKIALKENTDKGKRYADL